MYYSLLSHFFLETASVASPLDGKRETFPCNYCDVQLNSQYNLKVNSFPSILSFIYLIHVPSLKPKLFLLVMAIKGDPLPNYFYSWWLLKVIRSYLQSVNYNMLITPLFYPSISVLLREICVIGPWGWGQRSQMQAGHLKRYSCYTGNQLNAPRAERDKRIKINKKFICNTPFTTPSTKFLMCCK